MNMANNFMAGYLVNRLLASVALLCLFFASFPASAAETIEAKLPHGITATASFHKGVTSLPAVLVLHGFLQTHHSQPMNSLAGNLASKGYTVLSPTSSLGVNRRIQSMACESAHTHTVEQEISEISYWVNWLSSKGYKNIVPIGFSSTGNFEILQYNLQGSHPAIKHTILTSLNPIYIDAAERQKTRAATDSKQISNSTKLGKYSLGYCKKNYIATTNSYLSYAHYDSNRILELIRKTQVPTEIILGTADTILPANWSSQIKAANPRTRISYIKNANHFFDDTSEFELAEEIEAILKNLATPPS